MKHSAAKKPPTKTRKRIKRAPTRALSRPITLHLLSDSTGNLAQHMLTAFLTQFPPDAFNLHRRNFLDSEPKLNAALDEVALDPGIAFHAFVSPVAKRLIEQRCKKAGTACCDLTGEFVDFLARKSGIQPQANVARLHDISDEYHRRIKAVEFALEHDDGLGLETLYEADFVLTGVSRTSKTPTSIYLAQQGWRVGNVSLALGIEPPKQLLELKGRKVVGLIIDPETLVEIRSNRQANWRMTTTRYNDPEQVSQEVAWSKRLFNQQGWPVLNVTDQAVEETAARIINTLGLTRPKAPAGETL